MIPFENFNLTKQLRNVIEELGFEKSTPIQAEAFSVILSGKDVVGIAQTGTGKTFAYLLPILQDIKFSKQLNPRVLILVPTRELVQQVAEQAEILSTYMNVRVMRVFGGVNINTQKLAVSGGSDILVATPGRLYDLVMCGALQLKGINKLVIDEVDVMLDLGFRVQLANILGLMPERRQNIMFSATMTDEVDALIDDVFLSPVKISIAVS
jgi:ATP-dependent RNA helicase RhlE